MDDPRVESPSFELGRYARVLRRRWLVVLLCTLVGLALALAYALLAAPRVTATALVKIDVINSDGFESQRSASTLIDIVTEEQLARSSPVFDAAATALARQGYNVTIADVRRNVDVRVLPDATVATVAYTGATTAEATAGADVVGNAYIDYRTDAAVAKVDRIINKLQKSRDALRAQLVRVNGVLGRAGPNTRQASEALSDRQVLNLQLNTLVSQINTMDGVDTSGGSLVTRAEDNPVAVQPHKRLLAQIGAALGLIVGLIAAFVVQALDRRVADPSSVERAGGGPVLASLGSTAASIPVRPEDEDEIRSVREQVLATLHPEHRVLTVVDLSRAAFSGDVAANLALSIAETGRRVALFLPGRDDEFVQRLSHWVGVEASRSAQISGVVGSVLNIPESYAASTPLLLDQPDVAPNPSRDHTLVVVALAPGASRSLLMATARRGNPVVLVAAQGRTDRNDISGVAEALSSMGAPVVGTVLVSAQRRLAFPPEAGERTLVATDSRA